MSTMSLTGRATGTGAGAGVTTTTARVLVLSGRGLNCELETLAAFQRVGIDGDIRHVDDVFASDFDLDRYQVLAVPGGFSFGDHTGAGKALSNRMRDEFGARFSMWMDDPSHLAIGICNGCQALVKSGLWTNDLTAVADVSLAPNVGGHYKCQWETVGVAPGALAAASPWFSACEAVFELPIAHGEGRFILGTATDTVGLAYQGENPNGADAAAAAVLGYDGRLLAMMPHPERAVRFTQHPTWTASREALKRASQSVPTQGPGLQIFRSARAFVDGA